MLTSERSECHKASAAKMRCANPLLAWLVSAFASASGAAAMPSETARDWLIKQVCVDAADVALSVDPYPACPAGTSARTLRFGEALPYHNIDQPGGQALAIAGWERGVVMLWRSVPNAEPKLTAASGPLTFRTDSRQLVWWQLVPALELVGHPATTKVSPRRENLRTGLP